MNYKKRVRFCYSRTLMTHITITYKKHVWFSVTDVHWWRTSSSLTKINKNVWFSVTGVHRWRTSSSLTKKHVWFSVTGVHWWRTSPSPTKKTCLILCHMRLLMTHIVITYTHKKYNSLLQALCHMEVRSLFSISHYRATWWSVHRFLPVTTVSHATSHYHATWWSDHRAFHQLTQCHMVVRSSFSISHCRATWWSDHCAFHQ